MQFTSPTARFSGIYTLKYIILYQGIAQTSLILAKDGLAKGVGQIGSSIKAAGLSGLGDLTKKKFNKFKPS